MGIDQSVLHPAPPFRWMTDDQDRGMAKRGPTFPESRALIKETLKEATGPGAIEAQWLRFLAVGVSPDCSPAQVESVRDVFYMGVSAGIDLMVRSTDHVTSEIVAYHESLRPQAERK